LSRASVAATALLVMMGMFASVAYAATVHGTKSHDWGKAKDGLADPPNCGARCGDMIHGTNGNDTIYGHEGWDYIGAEGGTDVVHGGLGMEIVQGGKGNDSIFGEVGHDHLFGGPGNDKIYAQDSQNEPGNVEQIVGEGGRDLCVVDEDPRDGVIAHKSCETLVIKKVPGMSGATKIFNTHNAEERGDAVPGKFHPGTHHLN
jgi:Ca2+-binding RTX toxin-like protein